LRTQGEADRSGGGQAGKFGFYPSKGTIGRCHLETWFALDMAQLQIALSLFMTAFRQVCVSADERVDRDTHRAAMQRVVEAAGHSRASKANAYLSTYRVQAAKQSPKVTLEQADAALAKALGNKSHAATALGISRQSLYRLLAQMK
jgi:DNA-binding NtrC family response regulator